MISLNLGCGSIKAPDWIGVDKVWVPGVDIVYDLEKTPWTWADTDNWADEVFMENVWEHIENIIPFMNELYRIMKPDAWCRIISPYYTSIRAWQDPTHVREVSENSFLYYNAAWRKSENLEHMGINTNFEYQFKFIYEDNWKDEEQDKLFYAIRHFNNVVSDIEVYLQKK